MARDTWTSDDGRIVLYCGDSLEIMPTMATESVDCVVTDPPYFEVKDCAWDHQWDNRDAFLKWLGRCVDEWARTMRSNSSLYCFASPQMASRVEIAISDTLHVLNHIIWDKGPSAIHARSDKATLRSYFPRTERIIFAEHYHSDNIAKGEASYVGACDKARGLVFEPLRRYLRDEWARAGLTVKDANKATGCAGMAGHYFGASQWQLPTAAHYEALRQYANAEGGDYLRREYEDLRREYEDLRREYEDLRRPFFVTPQAQYTDVWTFDTAPSGRQNGSPRHPCQKPIDLLTHILTASTRPDAVVFDPFAGSGSTAVTCALAGRRFIGIEIDRHWFEVAVARTQEATQDLFAVVAQ